MEDHAVKACSYVKKKEQFGVCSFFDNTYRRLRLVKEVLEAPFLLGPELDFLRRLRFGRKTSSKSSADSTFPLPMDP